MEKQSHPSARLLLFDNPGLGKLDVELEAFFEFSFWLAEELEDLVAQWAHKAAPRAVRSSRSQPQSRI